jgi:hypothetical protein
MSSLNLRQKNYTNTKEEAERRILERFSILNDPKVLHNYFASYDFHENERDMVLFWKDVIMFIYESIFCNFALHIEDIIEVTKLKNKRPIGLQNILVINVFNYS